MILLLNTQGAFRPCLFHVMKYAVAIWPVTDQGFQNTKWPAVLYSQ